MNTYRDFLRGFAYGAELVEAEAEEQWGWYSRPLPESERLEIEEGGYVSGVKFGLEFKRWAKDNS